MNGDDSSDAMKVSRKKFARPLFNAIGHTNIDIT
jgi:hypothetical protein